MDVLKPELFIARGFRFRVNPGDVHGPSRHDNGRFYEEDEGFPGKSRHQVDDGDDFKDEGGLDELVGDFRVDVKEPYPGKFEAKIAVPSVLFGAVIGKGARTKMRIEKETMTSLKVPKVGAEGDVVITATDKSKVVAAARRIHMIVETQRHRLKFTHFVSLPLNKEPFKTKCKEFQTAVLECCEGELQAMRIDERLFTDPAKMHMTVQLVTLLDDRERSETIELLRKCYEEKVRPILSSLKQLAVHIRGLEIMNDDFGATQVLYGRVEPVKDSIGQRDLLQEMADAVAEYFRPTGRQVKVEDSDGYAYVLRGEKVKLHVTLMNSKNMVAMDGDSDDEAAVSSAWKFRPKGTYPTFDARTIYANLKDFDFGTTVVNEMHLSQLHTVAEDGYYRPSIVIPLFKK